MDERDPYRAPDAPLRGQLPPRPALGIAVGFLVDVGGTFVLSIVLAVFYGVMLAAGGLDEAAIESRMISSGYFSPLGVASLALGLGMSFLGGLTCVRVGRLTDLRPAAVLAFLVGALGLYWSGPDDDLGTNLALALITAAAILFGARHGLRSGRD